MKSFLARVYLAILLTCALNASSQEFLDHTERALTLQTANGLFSSHLSGLVDLEGYYVDQHPPGLLFPEHSFFNPRLSLFLDTQVGKHIYLFVQARADRGFDPGSSAGEVRADEYLLRYTPLNNSSVNVQVGKFATVVGNYVQRHFSWENPFITAPLPYENVTSALDQGVVPSPAVFLMLKDAPDNKRTWLPVIWGPSYATGASLFGTVEKVDYAVEVKNAALSSRPAAWDGMDLGFDNPTVSGRLGYRPDAAWNFGLSGSGGGYLLPEAEEAIDAGYGAGRTHADYRSFHQYTFGHDVSYAHGLWQFWGEVFFSRFEVPNVGDADSVSYYLEAKYKFTSQLFGALRWNQQLFSSIQNGTGREPWDREIWRIDSALGYRINRHWQTKLQYSFSQQQGSLQQGEQLVAGQLTLKF